MRRTNVARIYRKTGNLRAVQIPLGHTNMDCTVRYPGVELEDALYISEPAEICAGPLLPPEQPFALSESGSGA